MTTEEIAKLRDLVSKIPDLSTSTRGGLCITIYASSGDGASYGAAIIPDTRPQDDDLAIFFVGARDALTWSIDEIWRLRLERDALSEAIRLLHMLDREPRHPDVAAFLDGLHE